MFLLDSELEGKTKLSHISMFNIYAGHKLHLDFAQYKKVNYLFVVDRLRGYIQVEKVPNQQTSSAIQGVRK